MAKKKKENKGVQKFKKFFPRNSKLTGWEIVKWFTVLVLMVITTGIVYFLIELRSNGHDISEALAVGVKEGLAILLYTVIFGILFWLLFRERAD